MAGDGIRLLQGLGGENGGGGPVGGGANGGTIVCWQHGTLARRSCRLPGVWRLLLILKEPLLVAVCPAPGEARTCPARCDDKAGRPDAATTRLALRLTILPPSLPPNGTGRRLGGRSRVRAKEPVRGHGRDLSAQLELRHTCQPT